MQCVTNAVDRDRRVSPITMWHYEDSFDAGKIQNIAEFNHLLIRQFPEPDISPSRWSANPKTDRMFTGHRFANIVGRPRREGIFAEAAPKHAHERTPKGGICDVNDIRKADSTPFNFGFRISLSCQAEKHLRRMPISGEMGAFICLSVRKWYSNEAPVSLSIREGASMDGQVSPCADTKRDRFWDHNFLFCILRSRTAEIWIKRHP